MKKRLRKGKPVIALLLAIVLVLSGIPLYPGDHIGIAKASTTLLVNPNQFSPVYGGQTDLTFVYNDPDMHIGHQQTSHSTNIQICEPSAGIVPNFLQMIHSGSYPTSPPGQPTVTNIFTWNGFTNGAPLQEGAYQVCVTPTDAPTTDDDGNPVYYGVDSSVSILNPAPPAPKYIEVAPGTDRLKTTHQIRGIAERGTEVFLDIQYTIRDENDHQVPGERLQKSVIVPFDSPGDNEGTHLTWSKGTNFLAYLEKREPEQAPDPELIFPLRDDNKPEKYVREWSYELTLNPYEIATITAHVRRLPSNPYFSTVNDSKNQSGESTPVKFLRYVAPEWNITWEALAGYYYKTESVQEVVNGVNKNASYNLTKPFNEPPYNENRTLSVCNDGQTCPDPIKIGWNIIIPEPLLAGEISYEEFQDDLKYEQITNKRGFKIPAWWDPINLATGDFSFHHTNISLQAVMPLEFGITYHSRDTYDGSAGYGWHHTYEWRLEHRENGNLYLITPDGAAYLYTPNANGAYTTPAGTYGQLTKLPDGTYKLGTPQQLTYLFRQDGMLYRIQDTNGNETRLSYTNTMLMKVETQGASMTFEYLKGGKIASITDQLDRKTMYEYDELNHDLLSVRLPDEGTIRFRYNKKHELEEIDNPNNTATLKNVYDEQGRVIFQRDFYGAEGEVQYLPDQHKTVTTDPLKRVKTFEYDERFRQTAIHYPDGTTERFTYDANDNMTSKIDQRGNTWKYVYDVNGNLLQTADPMSHTTTIHYNAWNKPDEVTDALGYTTRIGYDTQGNMISLTNPLGETSKIERDGRGVPTEIVNPKQEKIVLTNDGSGFAEFIQDPLGNRQKLVRDGLHRVTDIVDVLGRITKMEYDDRDRVKARIDALQQREEFRYDKDSNLIYHKDAAGAETEVTYEFNRVKTVKDALDGTTTMDYDKVGNLVKKTAPNGAETEYVYNNVNRMETMIVKDLDEAGNVVRLITEFRYDENGNLIWKKDPKGQITEIHYDNRNLPDWIKDASGAVTSYAYDGAGRLTLETNALGNSTAYRYDAAGRMDQVKDALGNATAYEYDKAGRLEKVKKPNNAVWTMQYDARGLLSSTIDPLGNTTALERDALGQVKVSKDAAGAATKYSYDELGRVTSIVDALSHITSMDYDPMGRIRNITDANSRRTSYNYDALGRLSSVTNALEASTSYTYDPVGNITSKTDALGRNTGYKYNLRNQLIEERNPLQQITKLGYDANGNTISILNPDNQSTRFEYDIVNQLTSILYPDNRQVSYTYDELGRRKSMVDATGTTSYAYDALNRLTQVTNGANQTIGYEWTSTGQRSKVLYPDRTAVTYQYDLLDRMTSVTDGSGLTTSYIYDSRSLLTQKKPPTQGISTYQYDALGQVLDIRHANQHGKVVEQLQYAYDPVGNRSRMERVKDANDEDDADAEDHRESLVSEYAYDALNQLTQVKQYNTNSAADPSEVNYSYDRVGNRLTKDTLWGTMSSQESYTYDNADKLLHWQNGSNFKDFSYDPRGNLTKIMGIENDVSEQNSLLISSVSSQVYGTDSVSGGVYSQPIAALNTQSTGSAAPELLEEYVWDSANRLKKHRSAKKDISQFFYDGDGNRTKMIVDVEHGPTDHSNGNGQGNDNGNSGGNGNSNGNSNSGNANCHIVPPGFIPPGLAKKCGQYEEPYPDMHPGGPREGWEPQFKKKHWEFNYTNDVSLANPEPLQVTDKDQLSGSSDYYRWKETYTYGAGGERISMNYLPAYDANNGWDPHDGTAGAEPGVAPRTLFYLDDALGSAVGLIEKDGRVSSRYHYDEFGIPTDAKKFDVNWPGPDNLFGYTGLGYDYYSGMSYARARYYKPELGRFASEDSYKGRIGDPQSQNGYAYVWNNPLIYVDPTGHDTDYRAPAYSVDWHHNQFKDYDFWKSQLQSIINSGNLTTQFSGYDSLLNGSVQYELMLLKQGFSVGDKYYKLGMEYQGIALRDNACSYLPDGCNGGSAYFENKGDGYLLINSFTQDGDEEQYLIDSGPEGPIAGYVNCFIAGTLVATDEGDKPIEDIKVGDKVLSVDTNSGEISYKEVEMLFRNETNIIDKITVGNTTITVTEEHPFWVKNKGWVKAKDLRDGDVLVTDDNRELVINNIEVETVLTKTYNFKVKDNHTYFITKEHILVHNMSRSAPQSQGTPYSSQISWGQDGKIEKYTTYDGNGNLVKEVRITGKDHGNIPRPNVKVPKSNVNPKTGQIFQNGYEVRPAEDEELPNQP